MLRKWPDFYVDIDELCVMYESGAGEDVEHLLVTCGNL